MVKELQNLFAVLNTYRHNIHMLHWKIVGEDFDCTHRLFDSYVGQFNTFIDEVAEMILSLNGNPLTIQECIDVITHLDKEILVLESDEDYDNEKAFKAIAIMFESLYDMYTHISRSMSEDLSECAGKLDEHKYWLRIEGKYKNKKRMKD